MNKAKCAKCGEEKDAENEFYWGGGYRKNTCKVCHKKNSAEWMRDKAEKIQRLIKEAKAQDEA